jgi:lysophospholipase L1-like esterase
VSTARAARRSREALSGLALAAASVLLILLASEAGLRALGFTPRRFHGTARLIDPHWRLLLDCYPSNPRGYFDIDLRDPQSRARYGHLAPLRFEGVVRRAPYALESRYNSLRFRDGEFGPKRRGVRRVMVLGDSFTEGQGVKEPDTYARVLESRLKAADPAGWEVLNCGRRGADFPALFETFEELLRYDPDIVVYGMVLNDADQSEAFHARQAYVNDLILDRGRMPDGRFPPEMGPFDSRLLGFVRDRLETRRTTRETTRWYLDMYGEPNREGWERTQGYLREMNRRMRERGGRFLIASWPLLVNMEGEDPFDAATSTVARFCVAAGIPRHDLRPALRGRRTSSLWVHPVDMHPNEVAHRLAAESLAPVVRDLWSTVR